MKTFPPTESGQGHTPPYIKGGLSRLSLRNNFNPSEEPKSHTIQCTPDSNGITMSFPCPWCPLLKRKNSPVLPRHPLDHGNVTKKCTPEHVVEALQVGPTQRKALIDRLMAKCQCSESPAKDAILHAEGQGLIVSSLEPNPRGGKEIKWLRLPEHKTNG